MCLTFSDLETLRVSVSLSLKKCSSAWNIWTLLLNVQDLARSASDQVWKTFKNVWVTLCLSSDTKSARVVSVGGLPSRKYCSIQNKETATHLWTVTYLWMACCCFWMIPRNSCMAFSFISSFCSFPFWLLSAAPWMTLIRSHFLLSSCKRWTWSCSPSQGCVKLLSNGSLLVALPPCLLPSFHSIVAFWACLVTLRRSNIPQLWALVTILLAGATSSWEILLLWWRCLPEI